MNETFKVGDLIRSKIGQRWGAVVEVNPDELLIIWDNTLDGPIFTMRPSDVEKTTWTEAKNERRCLLIEKELDKSITVGEAYELDQLQTEMLKYRAEVAPLPTYSDLDEFLREGLGDDAALFLGEEA